VSLTGGEPLIHAEYLQTLIPLISGTRRGIFLETNGTLPLELAKIIHLIDIISMDMKLQSSTGAATPWDLHGEFLKIAAEKEVYIKIVISAKTSNQEVRQAGELLQRFAPGSVLVLQPVTPKAGVLAPPVERVLQLQDQALQLVGQVRVVPQTHLMMGQL